MPVKIAFKPDNMCLYRYGGNILKRRIVADVCNAAVRLAPGFGNRSIDAEAWQRKPFLWDNIGRREAERLSYVPSLDHASRNRIIPACQSAEVMHLSLLDQLS